MLLDTIVAVIWGTWAYKGYKFSWIPPVVFFAAQIGGIIILESLELMKTQEDREICFLILLSFVLVTYGWSLYKVYKYNKNLIQTAEPVKQ